jgi:hypothetical protein
MKIKDTNIFNTVGVCIWKKKKTMVKSVIASTESSTATWACACNTQSSLWWDWNVNFMWCVFHSAQWYWSDNLCILVTDQWRASLGVRDSESCWLTEEIGTYMRCWESPGDLPLVIEIFVSFRSFRYAPLANNIIERYEIHIT